MKKLNQKGFGLIEGLLIVIAITLIGFTGYYVWNSHKNDDAPVITQQKTSTSVKTKVEKDETADWLLYQAPSGNYKLRLPDGWKFQRYQEDDSIIATNSSDTNYTKGVLATVSRIEFGRDFANVSCALFYGDSKDVYRETDLKKLKGFTTKQGLTVEKYTRTQVEEQQALGPSQGTVTYRYYIVHGAKTLSVSHDIAPGETDKTSIIEKSLSTVELL